MQQLAALTVPAVGSLVARYADTASDGATWSGRSNTSSETDSPCRSSRWGRLSLHDTYGPLYRNQLHASFRLTVLTLFSCPASITVTRSCRVHKRAHTYSDVLRPSPHFFPTAMIKHCCVGRSGDKASSHHSCTSHPVIVCERDITTSVHGM